MRGLLSSLGMLVAMLPAAGHAALFGLLDDTLAWREEVELHSGGKLLVDRTATWGPDAFFRKGRGGIRALTLALDFQGRRVTWSLDQDIYSRMPLVLDVVEGAPVLVFAVRGWKECKQFDFPRQGLVALHEARGDWTRLPSATLPAGLRVNLLGDYDELRRDPPGRQSVVNANWKEKVDFRWPDRGKEMSQVSARVSADEYSCGKLKRAPDAAMDKRLAESARIAGSAREVVARPVEKRDAPQPVTPEDVRQNLGHWMQAAWVASSCGALVRGVEPRYRSEEKGGSLTRTLAGYAVHLETPAGLRDIAIEGSNPMLAMIACDSSGVLMMRRSSAERALVHRFDLEGRPLDATWITFPEAKAVTRSQSWPTPWSMSRSPEGELTVVLADYVYTGTMNGPGSLQRQARYAVTLPPLP